MARILIVEDEGIGAMDLKYTLEALGHEVVHIASRGEEAIEKSLEMLPDLVLMDIILKGDIDGITAAEELSKSDIPFIYLTANSENATQERALATKPLGYVLKPFENIELKEAVESAIKQTKDNI
ncbi:MAG: response regulator [Methanobacteriaceae archaeon]|nr:response regulator [Methanobacteriaceae archaeon]MDP2836927.1 response regulator [Methanobacteriaceae archaeon]MDP3035735.1 response regulator [Methanobacteriaceae archaeon]MDP3483895.1 response regulator [Methanobacteriaceae archaeon]MDP3623247.1 response regulator [Methanobacteriaceae archaeon]